MFKRKLLEEKVNPSTSALIVVDMQNDFVHHNGVFRKYGENLSAIQEMIPRLKELIGVARQTGIPIIYLRNITTYWVMSEVHRERIDEVRAGEDYTLEGSWGAEFCEGILPKDNERVVIKHRYSGFVDTNLDLVLRSLGIKTLILTGVATNVCVESTARDGFMKDYRIILVEDCCAAYHNHLHESTLENINRTFGTVVSSKEIISAWSRRKLEKSYGSEI